MILAARSPSSVWMACSSKFDITQLHSTNFTKYKSAARACGVDIMVIKKPPSRYELGGLSVVALNSGLCRWRWGTSGDGALPPATDRTSRVRQCTVNIIPWEELCKGGFWPSTGKPLVSMATLLVFLVGAAFGYAVRAGVSWRRRLVRAVATRQPVLGAPNNSTAGRNRHLASLSATQRLSVRYEAA
jgi:hypothetical protein